MYKKIDVMDILCSLGLEKVEAEEKTKDYNNFMSVLNKEEYKETVDHPNHYNTGKYEAIEVIEDWKLNFNLGNAVKYISRCEHKANKEEDIKKAIWYLERELKNK